MGLQVWFCKDKMKTKLVAWKFHQEKLSSGCYIGHRLDLDLLCALALWRFLNNYTAEIGCCLLWKPAVRNHTQNIAVSFIGGLLSVCEYWHWEFLRLLLVSLISSALPVQSSVHWLVLLSYLILSNSHLTWLLPSSSCVCVSAISCGNLNLPSPNWYAWAAAWCFGDLILCEPCYSGMGPQRTGCELAHKFGSDWKINAFS